ncbi:hypothetical protein Tco_1215761 [Tanacetum coccineum]
MRLKWWRYQLWEAVMSMKGFDATEIIRVLAGQLITVAAMADGSYHGFTVKGLDKAEIVRILAGQLITVAAMADASSLSIVSLSQPHFIVLAVLVEAYDTLKYALAAEGGWMVELQGRPAQRELLKHRDYEVDLDCCLGKTQNREDYFNICKMLYAASVTGEWETAKNILDRHLKQCKYLFENDHKLLDISSLNGAMPLNLAAIFQSVKIILSLANL